jgi:hypothetical protein
MWGKVMQNQEPASGRTPVWSIEWDIYFAGLTISEDEQIGGVISIPARVFANLGCVGCVMDPISDGLAEEVLVVGRTWMDSGCLKKVGLMFLPRRQSDSVRCSGRDWKV